MDASRDLGLGEGALQHSQDTQIQRPLPHVLDVQRRRTALQHSEHIAPRLARDFAATLEPAQLLQDDILGRCDPEEGILRVSDDYRLRTPRFFETVSGWSPNVQVDLDERKLAETFDMRFRTAASTSASDCTW